MKIKRIVLKGTSPLDGAECLLADCKGIMECRILRNGGGPVLSGYFDSATQLARALNDQSDVLSTASAYVTLNPVDPLLLTRAKNKFVRAAAGNVTADKDIVQRRWFAIDVDSKRKTGLSATDRECQKAIEKRDEIVRWLKEQGWPACVSALSGNGAHALFRVDLPNTPEVTEIFKGALRTLDTRFSDDHVTVDIAVSNPARIWKLYGTVARKGPDTPKRPHRRARIEHQPRDLVTVPIERLRALASGSSHRREGGRFSAVVENFKSRGLYGRNLGDGRHAVECPWRDRHTTKSNDTDTVLFEPSGENGQRGAFKCQHSRCAQRTLIDVLKYLPARRGQLKRMADVAPEQVEFFWSPYIPLGKLTLVDGDPGIGKSWLSLALATAASRGDGLPGMEPRKPASVLLLTAEDGLGDTVRPRLDRMGGANLRRIHALEGLLQFDEPGCDELREHIGQIRPTLVVVDPLVAYVGAGVDINRPNEMRAVTARLGEIAAEYGCAIVLVRHLTKSGKDKAIYRGLGSIDITAACRSVLLVGKDPTDADAAAFVHIKSNLRKSGTSQGYRIENGKFRWTGPSAITSAELLAPETSAPSLTDKAVEFLREALRGGERASTLVRALAKKNGITEKPLRRACKRLDIRHRTIRTVLGQTLKSLWTLPDSKGRANGQVGKQTGRKP